MTIPFHQSEIPDLRDRVMDNLEDYSKEQIILGLVKFLNYAQLEDLKDSLDREIF
jgi:hypothetical protein